jgi:hypothetical protein
MFKSNVGKLITAGVLIFAGFSIFYFSSNTQEVSKKEKSSATTRDQSTTISDFCSMPCESPIKCKAYAISGGSGNISTGAVVGTECGASRITFDEYVDLRDTCNGAGGLISLGSGLGSKLSCDCKIGGDCYKTDFGSELRKLSSNDREPEPVTISEQLTNRKLEKFLNTEVSLLRNGPDRTGGDGPMANVEEGLVYLYVADKFNIDSQKISQLYDGLNLNYNQNEKIIVSFIFDASSSSIDDRDPQEVFQNVLNSSRASVISQKGKEYVVQMPISEINSFADFDAVKNMQLNSE